MRLWVRYAVADRYFAGRAQPRDHLNGNSGGYDVQEDTAKQMKELVKTEHLDSGLLSATISWLRMKS